MTRFILTATIHVNYAQQLRASQLRVDCDGSYAYVSGDAVVGGTERKGNFWKGNEKRKTKDSVAL